MTEEILQLGRRLAQSSVSWLGWIFSRTAFDIKSVDKLKNCPDFLPTLFCSCPESDYRITRHHHSWLVWLVAALKYVITH